MSRVVMRQLVGLLGLLVLAPSTARGQTVFAGVGAGVPMGSFADVARTGYGLLAGGSLELGATPFEVALTGFVGRNGHRVAGERSDLYSVSALAGYRLVERPALRLTLWGGLGGTIHARRSDDYPGLDASRNGLTLSGGAKGSYSLDRVRLFVLGLYTRGVGGLGSSSYPTELVTLAAGVAVPLGVD